MAKKSKKKVRYGMNVVGYIPIYCVEKQIKVGNNISLIRSYWTNLSRKTDDEWLSKSIPVYFAKGIELPEHNSTIGLIDAWLFLVGYDDKNIRIALYIADYEEVE